MEEKRQTIENPNSTVYKNFLAGTGCEKLYLDLRTADVTFLFTTAHGVKCAEVPAHKSILAAMSPVFDAMFFGPAKEMGDIRIVDVKSEAFKAFLQFFYLTEVELSAEHLIDVMNLGKQYMMSDCLVACTKFCISTLTLEKICWAYELAILFDLDELREFCEHQIRQHPIEIFRSQSFLNCEMDLLRNILELNAFGCSEAIIFDGCIAWAERACTQNTNQMVDSMLLRARLGDLFYEIRFGEFTHKQFHDRYCLFNGLFSLDEFRDITMMIANKDFFRPSSKFKRRARSVNKQTAIENDMQICNRKAMNRTVWYKVDHCEHSNACIDKTVFESSKPQQLKEFQCSAKFQGIDAMAKIKINKLDDNFQRKNLLFFAIITMFSAEETVITLPAPITIQPDQKYEIEFELDANCLYSSELVRNTVRMDNGTVIKFSGKQLGMQSLIKALHFCGPNDEQK